VSTFFAFVLTEPKYNLLPSSQSVSRLNDSWSNNITRGPKRGTTRSGFAGRDDLEMTRRYRDEAQSNKSSRSDGYGMVFDVPSRRKRSRSRDQGDSRERRRKRSQSPSSRRDSDHEKRPRSRSRERRSGRGGRS
jgi:peptidyl-prolyl cis-trans isomerase-like 4